MSVTMKRKNFAGDIGRFLTEVWGELKKVQWPSREELYGFTIMVIVAIVAVGAYIGAMDAVLTRVSDFVFHLGPK